MIEWLQALWQKFAEGAISLLPLSPFREFINSAEIPNGLAWLNWFVPVSGIIRIFTAWLVAYAAYLLIRVILHWLKVVG